MIVRRNAGRFGVEGRATTRKGDEMILEQNANNLPHMRTKRRDARSEDQSRAGFVIDLVALATGVSAADIRAATRCNARAARARQIAMYLAYVSWSWPMTRIGGAFGRDRTTAGYACRIIEDMRDDAAFDSWLERLEEVLRGAPEPRAMKLLSPDLSEMAA